jgi:hypothetical protein
MRPGRCCPTKIQEEEDLAVSAPELPKDCDSATNAGEGINIQRSWQTVGVPFCMFHLIQLWRDPEPMRSRLSAMRLHA